MSEQPKKTADTPATTPLPAFVPEDLVPVWLWCRQNGAQWLITIAVAVLLAVGVAVFARHRDRQAALASEQLLQQPATPEALIQGLEKTVADYGSTPPGVAAKLKLAKAYYDANPPRYADALAAYDNFIKQNGSHPFVDVAKVGRGFALCGLNKNDEAIEVFRVFRAKNPGHYLVQQATFGEAACLTMQGKKDDAKALLQELRAANRETPWETAAKRMEGAIDRYQPRQARSLFDQAEALVPIPAPPKPAPVAITNAVP